MIIGSGLRIHLFGGTSDALELCRLLEQQGLNYSLSVATEVGQQLARGIQGQIVVGRMDQQHMQAWLAQQQVSVVIDATHPFAAEVSRNVILACQALKITCLRFERPQQIDNFNQAGVIKVDNIEQACQQASQLGERIFLTTGSKNLADYVRMLPKRSLIARVLPTVEVIESCYQLGLTVDQIVALKGPFDADMNLAMYRRYRADVVITKESGTVGGYQQKIEPCLTLGIPCIVIRRPKIEYQQLFSDFTLLLQHLHNQINYNNNDNH